MREGEMREGEVVPAGRGRYEAARRKNTGEGEK